MLILHVPHVLRLIILQLKRRLELGAEHVRGRLNIERGSGGGCRWTAVTSAVRRKKKQARPFDSSLLCLLALQPSQDEENTLRFLPTRVRCAPSSRGLWEKAKPKAPECQIISALNNSYHEKTWKMNFKTGWKASELWRSWIGPQCLCFPFPRNNHCLCPVSELPRYFFF